MDVPTQNLSAATPSGVHSPSNDPGMTAIRKVPPTFVLRGLAGGVFGRTYPLEGPIIVGRSPACDIYINHPGLSREHAKLTPGNDGVLVEDQNSTNGSFVGGLRVSKQWAHAGDEIAFDQVRFQLVGPPGQQQKAQATAQEAITARSRVPWLAFGVGLIALVVSIVLIFISG